MNLTISGHHVELTPALDAYVRAKLDTVLSHFGGVVSIDVTLTAERRTAKAKDCRQRACTKIVMKDQDVHVVDTHGNLYAAINGMIDKLDRKVLTYKEKTKHPKRKVCRKRTAH